MKILVAIANYGTGSREYVDKVMDTYRSMSHDVHIVILSNIPKEMGEDVEVVVGLPSKNPWSLPFGHKQLFADRIDDYDLFIYSEDDILVSEDAVNAFVQASNDVNDDEIVGYMRVEYQPDGAVSYDMAHSFYRWDPRTVVERNGELYAWHSNEHAAVFILTRDHLRRSIESGGFLVEPYEHRYDLLCTAATDPYTSCGMKKLINLTRMQDFFVHHMPNKYIGRYGISQAEMDLQIEALTKIARGELSADILLDVEHKLPGYRGSKMLYDDADPATLEAIGSSASDILVVGGGFGGMESDLQKLGHQVTAVPVDSVAGHVLESKGISTLSADFDLSVEALAGRQFDVLVLPEILQLLEDPVAVLKSYKPFLKPGGRVVLTAPNMTDGETLVHRLKRTPGYQGISDFQVSGMHLVSASTLSSWMKQAGFSQTQVRGQMSPKRQKINRKVFRLLTGMLAHRWVAHATLA